MTPQTPAVATKVSQSPYTLDQIRANLKLIAGITALDLPKRMTPKQAAAKLTECDIALGDIQTICADILQRGIVGEVAIEASPAAYSGESYFILGNMKNPYNGNRARPFAVVHSTPPRPGFADHVFCFSFKTLRDAKWHINSLRGAK